MRHIPDCHQRPVTGNIGSTRVNAYDELKAGRAGPRAELRWPPSLPPAGYLGLAAERGWNIGFVLDTHIDRALFTGDSLFLSGVGRPDLSVEPEESRRRAHLLFGSLQHVRSLPADLLLLPGHTSQPIPFDRVPIAAPNRGAIG